MRVGQSVQWSNRRPGSFPRNRPSSVRQAVVSVVRWRGRSAADDHWRTLNIHRLDGVLWLAASCKIMLRRVAKTCANLARLLVSFTVVVVAFSK